MAHCQSPRDRGVRRPPGRMDDAYAQLLCTRRADGPQPCSHAATGWFVSPPPPPPPPAPGRHLLLSCTLVGTRAGEPSRWTPTQTNGLGSNVHQSTPARSRRPLAAASVRLCARSVYNRFSGRVSTVRHEMITHETVGETRRHEKTRPVKACLFGKTLYDFPPCSRPDPIV